MKRQQLMHVKYMCRAVDVQLGCRRASSGFPDCQEGGAQAPLRRVRIPGWGASALQWHYFFKISMLVFRPKIYYSYSILPH